MPTISSRPQVDEDVGDVYTPDEIAGIITDAVMYTMPKDMVELKLALHVTCRTLWNVDAIEDFYIYESPRSRGGCDVGFKMYAEPHYNVIQIN